MRKSRAIKRVIFFLIFGLVPIVLLYQAMLSHHVLPILSESISFDEKAYLMAEKETNKFDVLALGSSITLDNLSTEVMQEHLGQQYTYANLGSWGLKMHNHQEVLKVYVERFDPKVVIINASRRDFRGEDISIASADDLEMFLQGQYPYFYLKNINLYKMLSRNRWGGARRRDHSTPFSLAFDQGGGVSLHVPDSVTEMRPQCLEPHQPTDSIHYAALDSICQLLKRRRIQLVFVESIYNAPEAEEAFYRSVIAQHTSRTRSIVERNGHIHLDLSGLSQATPDSMFADDVHLNESGAIMLTQRILQQVNVRDLVTAGVSTVEPSYTNN